MAYDSAAGHVAMAVLLAIVLMAVLLVMVLMAVLLVMVLMAMLLVIWLMIACCWSCGYGRAAGHGAYGRAAGRVASGRAAAGHSAAGNVTQILFSSRSPVDFKLTESICRKENKFKHNTVQLFNIENFLARCLFKSNAKTPKTFASSTTCQQSQTYVFVQYHELGFFNITIMALLMC